MNKYFQVYAHPSNLQAKLATYQLQGNASLWWEQIIIVHNIEDKTMGWEYFQKFQRKIPNINVL